MPLCKSCKKEIVFLQTNSGSAIPVDYNSLSISEQSWLIGKQKLIFNKFKHVSHFATCPDAKKFRKPKRITLDTIKIFSDQEKDAINFNKQNG